MFKIPINWNGRKSKLDVLIFELIDVKDNRNIIRSRKITPLPGFITNSRSLVDLWLELEGEFFCAMHLKLYFESMSIETCDSPSAAFIKVGNNNNCKKNDLEILKIFDEKLVTTPNGVLHVL